MDFLDDREERQHGWAENYFEIVLGLIVLALEILLVDPEYDQIHQLMLPKDLYEGWANAKDAHQAPFDACDLACPQQANVDEGLPQQI